MRVHNRVHLCCSSVNHQREKEFGTQRVPTRQGVSALFTPGALKQPSRRVVECALAVAACVQGAGGYLIGAIY
jgi:hypothetical protein